MQKTAAPGLYDGDFVQWAEEQAAALRDARFADLDLENLAEEIAGLAASDRRALRSHMSNLLFHLLKLQYQPEKATSSWRTSVINASNEIQAVLEDSPSLRPAMLAISANAYAQARKLANVETGLPIGTFPKAMTAELRDAVQAALADAAVD